MRATGVTSRFLALLDVTLILLGILMISLAQTQEAAEAGARDQAASEQGAMANESGTRENIREPLEAGQFADFVFVFAGTAGTERGRCYLMDQDRNRIQEIRTDSNTDIRRIVETQSTGSRELVVMLMISNQGFDWMWSPDHVQALAKTWDINIVPVYRWD